MHNIMKLDLTHGTIKAQTIQHLKVNNSITLWTQQIISNFRIGMKQADIDNIPIQILIQ